MLRKFLVFVVLVINNVSYAANVDSKIVEDIKNYINSKIPQINVTNVNKSDIEGLYEAIAGSEIFYVTKDGRYLIYGGQLLDLSLEKEKWNLTEIAKNDLRKPILEQFNKNSMIIYSPLKDIKGRLTVFTDIDCGYCRKLHSLIPELNKNNIEVRYMAYPRHGLGSESYKKAVSVWCAKDKNEAMNLAKTGKSISFQDCNNPVREHFDLANQLGIKGTPTLIFDDGTLIPGFVPLDKLIKLSIEHSLIA